MSITNSQASSPLVISMAGSASWASPTTSMSSSASAACAGRPEQHLVSGDATRSRRSGTRHGGEPTTELDNGSQAGRDPPPAGPAPIHQPWLPFGMPSMPCPPRRRMARRRWPATVSTTSTRPPASWRWSPCCRVPPAWASRWSGLLQMRYAARAAAGTTACRERVAGSGRPACGRSRSAVDLVSRASAPAGPSSRGSQPRSTQLSTSVLISLWRRAPTVLFRLGSSTCSAAPEACGRRCRGRYVVEVARDAEGSSATRRRFLLADSPDTSALFELCEVGRLLKCAVPRNPPRPPSRQRRGSRRSSGPVSLTGERRASRSSLRPLPRSGVGCRAGERVQRYRGARTPPPAKFSTV